MIVYSFKPTTTLDLFPLRLHEQVNMDIEKRAEFMKKLHQDTRTTIEQQVARQADKMNMKKKVTLCGYILARNGSLKKETPSSSQGVTALSEYSSASTTTHTSSTFR